MLRPLGGLVWVVVSLCLADERRANGDAFAMVRAGRGSLLFRHVRKAAGTSMLKALEDVAEELMVRNNRTREFFGMHMEFSAFPAACFEFAPNALYVTVLRQPLSRVHSEYWYRGPRSDNVSAYLAWIRPKPIVTEGCPPGEYVDNLFTRSFSGRCVAPAIARPPPPPPGDQRPSAARYRRIWANDVCGGTWGGWRGGCAYDENASERASSDDLALALEVVDRFDVVIIMEWLASAVYRASIARLFGVSGFDVARRNSRHRHVPVRLWRPQPDAVVAVLRDQERMDSVLYARAVRNQCEDVRAWLAAAAAPPAARGGADPPCFSSPKARV